jgi:hypothetical protein
VSEIPVKQEEDALPARTLLLLLGATILATLLCIFVADAVLESSEEAVRPGRQFPEAELEYKDVVSNLELSLIEFRDHGAELAARKRAQLDGYGWVDREQGIVRIPVEKAMEILAGEAR